MKKDRFIVFSLFCFLLILGFTSSITFAQKNRDEKNKRIVLTKVDSQRDDPKNAYRFWKDGKKIIVQAINVIDPITKKRLEGTRVLRFRCKERAEM